jgi:hypothetical protein
MLQQRAGLDPDSIDPGAVDGPSHAWPSLLPPFLINGLSFSHLVLLVHFVRQSVRIKRCVFNDAIFFVGGLMAGTDRRPCETSRRRGDERR